MLPGDPVVLAPTFRIQQYQRKMGHIQSVVLRVIPYRGASTRLGDLFAR
jgi:hypothetical protein